MKYATLTQIASFLSKNTKKITQIKRVADMAFLLIFDGNLKLIFDLNKANSAIYSADNLNSIKEYKAPFDVLLKKLFVNSHLMLIEVPENNRILHIKALLSGSYKEQISNIYFEFTGRFTNAVLTDKNDKILEALHHQNNAIHPIMLGKTYQHLKPILIKEKPVLKIENFNEFFKIELEKIQNKRFNEIQKNKLINIEKKIEKLNQSLKEIPSKKSLNIAANTLFKQARALGANLYLLKDYERNFSIEFEGEILNFKLENSPKICANEMFKECKKLRQKASGIELQTSNLSQKIEFLERLKVAVLNTTNINELEILLPKKSAHKKQEKHADLIENFYFGDYKISVGKNEKANALLLANAKKDDFWFHLQAKKSAHIIVKTAKQKLNDEIIAFASRLCVEFSGYKSGSFLVDFTKRENVKIQNGAFVNYVNYNTVGVKI